MKSLRKMMVPRFYGKNPTPQGEEPMFNDEGLLTSTKSRCANPNNLLLEVIDGLHRAGAVFECVGTGLKVGVENEGRKDSVCVLHNVSDTSFGVYVLKRPPDALPDHDGFETDGAPIAGANTKSSRLTIPFEGNTAKPIVEFIGRLPSVFESGRKTTFNDGRPKKAKAKTDKPKDDGGPKAKKNKGKKDKNKPTEQPKVEEPPPSDDENDNVVSFSIGKDGKSSLDSALDELNEAPRRKKQRRKKASA